MSHELNTLVVVLRLCDHCVHSYLVDVFTGEGLYMDLDRSYQSKGLRQRVHQVQARDDHHVYVKLNLANALPSDNYAHAPRLGGESSVPQFPDW